MMIERLVELLPWAFGPLERLLPRKQFINMQVENRTKHLIEVELLRWRNKVLVLQNFIQPNTSFVWSASPMVGGVMTKIGMLRFRVRSQAACPFSIRVEWKSHPNGLYAAKVTVT